MEHLNSTFQVHRCNRTIQSLTKNQNQFLSRNLGDYLYKKYLENNSDIIPRYASAEDVGDGIDISLEVDQKDGTTVSVMNFHHKLFKGHTLVLVHRDTSDPFNTVLLSSLGKRAEISELLISLLENMDLDEPINILEHHFHPIALRQVLNGTSSHVPWTVFGDIDLVYTLQNDQINDNLRYISINFPKQDIQQFEGEVLVKCIDQFLQKHTNLSFEKLVISKFVSSFLYISRKGIIRISGTEEHLWPLMTQLTHSIKSS